MPLREIPDFIVALTAYEGDQRTQIALRLMVLTFARTTELRSAQWSEIENLEDKEPLWRWCAPGLTGQVAGCAKH